MRSHRVSSPNGARDDVYYWLRDDTRSDPDVLSYLQAENRYTETMLAPVQPLIDPFGRRVTDLRVSITDRCNFRCTYCMPQEGMPWLERDELLTYEEQARIVRVGVERFGFESVRITGGEPTVRAHLPRLIAMIAPLGIDIAMTTNGVKLPEMAHDLADAGLRRINVSLDSLRPEVVRELTRRHYVVRTAWVFHEEGANFPRTILSLRDRPEVRVVRDQIGSPTYAPHLAEAIGRLIETGAFGTYHFAGAGAASWYEVTCALYARLGVKTPVVPVTTEEFPRPAERPRYSVLATIQEPRIVLPPWQEGLAAFCARLTETI